MRKILDSEKEIFGIKKPIDLFTKRYYNYFCNLAFSRFEWTGLPDSIVPAFLEKVLFYNGVAAFFKEDVIETFAVMAVNLGGNMDIYATPNKRFAYANNYRYDLDKKNSVLIYDNMTDYPLSDYVMMHARSLANMRLTRDINIFSQRTPVAVAATADTRLTLSNIMNSYNQFIPFIEIDESLARNENLIKALDLKAPIVFDKLEVEMAKEKSACLTLLGIDSNAVDKSERMISGEVHGNNGEIEANRNASLIQRERACKQINKMFGLNVSVRFRTDIPITEEI